jgi:hypothetical protein
MGYTSDAAPMVTAAAKNTYKQGKISMRHLSSIPLCLGLMLGNIATAQADDLAQAAASGAPAATTAGVPQTLDLGAISVVGQQKVAQVLLTIKKALKAPESSDAKHRDDLVCRFVHELADPKTYLDCATNGSNQQRRSNTQTARLAPGCSSQKCDSPGEMQGFAESLVANQPGQRLHMAVKPAEFRKLMDSVSEAPVASSAPNPATVTAAPAATHN